MRVFVTYHKTGHHLCRRIAEATSKRLGLRCYDVSLKHAVPSDADVIVYESRHEIDPPGTYTFASPYCDDVLQDKDVVGVHVIRHPYEVIASAFRWHNSIERPWLEAEWQGTGKSYREHLESGDGLAFEMANMSRVVIGKMLAFPFDDQRFVTLKLEDFEHAFVPSVTRAARHLDLPEDIMLESSAPYDLNRLEDMPRYVTRKRLGTRSHEELFEPHHYDLFAELFPSDTLQRLGYAN